MLNQGREFFSSVVRTTGHWLYTLHLHSVKGELVQITLKRYAGSKQEANKEQAVSKLGASIKQARSRQGADREQARSREQPGSKHGA